MPNLSRLLAIPSPSEHILSRFDVGWDDDGVFDIEGGRPDAGAVRGVFPPVQVRRWGIDRATRVRAHLAVVGGVCRDWVHRPHRSFWRGSFGEQDGGEVLQRREVHKQGCLSDVPDLAHGAQPTYHRAAVSVDDPGLGGKVQWGLLKTRFCDVDTRLILAQPVRVTCADDTPCGMRAAAGQRRGKREKGEIEREYMLTTTVIGPNVPRWLPYATARPADTSGSVREDSASLVPEFCVHRGVEVAAQRLGKPSAAGEPTRIAHRGVARGTPREVASAVLG